MGLLFYISSRTFAYFPKWYANMRVFYFIYKEDMPKICISGIYMQSLQSRKDNNKNRYNFTDNED